MEVAGLGLVLGRSVAQGCFRGDGFFGPVSAEVAGLSLLVLWVCLSRTYSCGGCWPRPDPMEVTGLGLAEVAGSGLVSQMSLAQACFRRGHCLGSGPTEVAGSGLFA